MSVLLQSDASSMAALSFGPPPRPGAVMSPFGWVYADEAGNGGTADKGSGTNLLQAFSGSSAASSCLAPQKAATAATVSCSTDAVVVSTLDQSVAAPPDGPSAGYQGIAMLAPTESAPDVVANALQLIRDNLNAANIDSSSMSITGGEDLVWSPFGNFYNRQIVVRFNDGQWVRLDADLTLKNPSTCIWAIQQALGIPF
jgi:hypothetical protein